MKISKAFLYSDGTPGTYLKCKTCKKLGGYNECCPQFVCTRCGKHRPRNYVSDEVDIRELAVELGISDIVVERITGWPGVSTDAACLLCSTGIICNSMLVMLDADIEYREMLAAIVYDKFDGQRDDSVSNAFFGSGVCTALVVQAITESVQASLAIGGGVAVIAAIWTSFNRKSKKNAILGKIYDLRSPIAKGFLKNTVRLSDEDMAQLTRFALRAIVDKSDLFQTSLMVLGSIGFRLDQLEFAANAVDSRLCTQQGKFSDRKIFRFEVWLRKQVRLCKGDYDSVLRVL